MRREDTKPWYRQFWPWFIIALPAASVVGGLTTVWISLQTTDSLVLQSDDGVQAAAARGIAAEQEANRRGLRAILDVDPASGAIRVIMSAGERDDLPAALTLEIAHPAFAERDLELTLNRAMPDGEGNPVYAGHLTAMPDGRRYVVLRHGDTWRLATVWQGEPRLDLPQAAGDEGR